ncbi:Dynein light chain roadblock-type 1 [Sciurus carolinensis]|uniref:Dynein light chain roadblock-type 1 n=3 Tax=Boreoeutheria TaxID=1437010 RepID=A0AA41MC62_SCICA|nr:Dynein light chain roadblock-type 1 [Sciurus carolinensis]
MRLPGIGGVNSAYLASPNLGLVLWQAEVEETLKRLQSQKGVQGIIVVNTEGIPIKSTMDNPTTTQYANLMHNFILKARSTVREIDPQNDLTFLRIRSKKNEIMVAPGKGSFTLPPGSRHHSRSSMAIRKTSCIGICSGSRRA